MSNVIVDLPPEARVALGPEDHVLGPEDARIVVIEYGDYQCPYSARAVALVDEALARWSGDLRFVFRHFPLEHIHDRARAAAEAAEAAHAQGKFWEMHRALFSSPRWLGERGLRRIAHDLGLDVARFEAELEGRAHAARVDEDLRGGEALGVDSTPTFVINDLLYDGPVDDLLEQIESAASELPRRG